MELMDIIDRQLPPEPWAEGEKIPWHDPAFSARMLAEHLSQEHDAASRRSTIIDRQLAWIHHHLLDGRPVKILDLGCGPGLYTARLARLGHTCVGVDYAPASIDYARQQAGEEGLARYIQADVRAADYDTGYGLVMMVHGEINVFQRREVRHIVNKARNALDPGGLLLLEAHSLAMVREIGQKGRRWFSAQSGLFSGRPHLYLHESYWNQERQVAVDRYYIIDGETAEVARYAAATQAYSRDEYRALLEESGFDQVTFHASLAGPEDEPAQKGYLVLSARKTLPG